MNNDPLNDEELDFLSDVLLKYGNDDSILDVSELDGFLTAIISGPDMILPSRWFPEIWAGPDNAPEWESEAECSRFMSLAVQHMNNIVLMLMEAPDQFEALFNERRHEGKTYTIVEEWCFGYMRGVSVGTNWGSLPPEYASQLDCIRLHGTEEGFDTLEKLSPEQHQESLSQIEPAVRILHRYWLSQREPVRQEPHRAVPKVGRNDACPCGSGKKYKHCCLH